MASVHPFSTDSEHDSPADSVALYIKTLPASDLLNVWEQAQMVANALEDANVPTDLLSSGVEDAVVAELLFRETCRRQEARGLRVPSSAKDMAKAATEASAR